MRTNKLLVAAAALLAIAGSAWFIWHTTHSPSKINVLLHQGIGETLAEQALKVANPKGEIVVITMETRDSEVLATQFSAFKERLKTAKGARVGELITIDSEKKSKYGPGFGLSASKLSREIKKHSDASVFVSFVGMPSLDDKELKELGDSVPPLVAFCRSADKLESLLQRNYLRAAVVPRFQFPAPGDGMPRTSSEWFDFQFQAITPQGLGMLQ